MPNDITGKSIEEIVDLISQHCESKVTSDQVLAKLKGVKKGSPKQQFCEQIESLCNQLTRTYVKEGIPQATAKKIVTKSGIEPLVKTVPTENAKIVLQAGSFSSIEQAIQKFNELPDNSENNELNRIFSVNANQTRYQNRNQHRGNGRYAPRDAGNSNFYPRGTPSYNQRFNFNNTPPRFQRQFFPNGNYRGGRPNSRGHPHQGQRVNRIYFADTQTAASTPSMHNNFTPYMQNPNQPHWNMTPQVHQPTTATPPQNENFLGTVDQFSQLM